MRAVLLPLALSSASCAAALHLAVPAALSPASRSFSRSRACLAVDMPDAPGDVDYDEEMEPFPASAFPEEPAPVEPEEPAPIDESGVNAESAATRSCVKNNLLALAASCTRGEAATADDTSRARALISELESMNPTAEPTLSPDCTGTWELVYSDTQLFRSSPFFMAGRAVCADGDEANRYDWFCDMHRLALAISTIGKVRQVVSRDSIVSEFEVSAGAVPFLSDAAPFLSYSGAHRRIQNKKASAASAHHIPYADGLCACACPVQVACR